MTHLGQKLGFILALLTLYACGVSTIQIVDNNGTPVEGALVLSEIPPFIKVAIGITDKRGKTRYVADDGMIFKQGYYPLIGRSELPNRFAWHKEGLKAVTTLYPIKVQENIAVSEQKYIMHNPNADGLYDLPLAVCNIQQLSYDVETFNFRVISAQKDLLASERFYFVGAKSNRRVSHIEQKNHLAFYCMQGDALYKVGVMNSGGKASAVVPQYIFILTAKVDSPDAYLQPPVKCLSKYGARIGVYFSSNTKLYLSEKLAEKLDYYRNNIPCTNTYTDKMFDDIRIILEAKNNTSLRSE